MIPDLSVAENGELWGRIEVAKRRVIASLVLLHLPVVSQASPDSQRGITFDLLRPIPGGPAVMTGHHDGVITLNVEEADDVHREAARTAMGEPYRTLVGHVRHEVGHYYWDRLVKGDHWLPDFRELFGDERQDYGQAIQAHHNAGPPPDWRTRFVSGYASAHPWEDWAETWAHYLHMIDALDTALGFGLNAETSGLLFDPFQKSQLYRPEHSSSESFLTFLNRWVQLTAVVNELSRSMGEPDFYPFVLPLAAVKKLQFVHLVIDGAARNPESATPAAI
jgi:hypothetical protein